MGHRVLRENLPEYLRSPGKRWGPASEFSWNYGAADPTGNLRLEMLDERIKVSP